MAHGEFGGNGSVQWSINVADHAKYDHTFSKEDGHYHAGLDQSAGTTPGHDFTVSLKPPNGMTAGAFKSALANGGLSVKGGRVIFKVPIEKGIKGQIRVGWGT